MTIRCEWALGSPMMMEYHDREWGTPTHDDRELFELLILEGAQAGLSWSTILKQRDGYREAFRGFDAAEVARMGSGDVDTLLQSSNIVRNRAKIAAAIGNAAALMTVAAELGGFDRYIWSFVDGVPVQNSWKSLGEVPAQTRQSQAMSADLKARGFRFVGPTICYAFMQAVGMVNDHVVSCFRYGELSTGS